MKDNFKIRDKRNKGWFYLDNEYLNGLGKYFGPVGISVYVSLCRHANNDQQCFPSQELISKEVGASRQTVGKYIKLLASHCVIKIEKQKSKINNYENTLYTLLDKTEWLYPSHVKQTDMDSHVHLTAEPCTSDSKSHVNLVDTKDTNINNTNKKEATTSNPIGLQVSLIINSFTKINPSCKTYYGNKTQRSACEFLISEYGHDVVLNLIENVLPKTNKMEYMPKITTPYLLKEKWSSLKAGVETLKTKQDNKNNNIAFI